MLVLHNGERPRLPLVVMSPPTITESWPKKMQLNAELIPITTLPPSSILRPISSNLHPTSWPISTSGRAHSADWPVI